MQAQAQNEARRQREAVEKVVSVAGADAGVEHKMKLDCKRQDKKVAAAGLTGKNERLAELK